jgi:hypothetical protein
MSTLKKTQIIFPLFLSLFSFASPAFAAAPDGIGNWADNVFSFHQGLMKNGLPVPSIRSNPNAAVGIAENNTVEGNFFSLGFGGNIVLEFDSGITSGVFVVESTNSGYPIEKAKVEISENGITWVNAGQISQSGSVNKPTNLKCAKYIRITDVSNPKDFSDATADGYDVDGVKATGQPCTPPVNHDRKCNSAISNSNTSNNNTSKMNIVVTGRSNIINK